METTITTGVGDLRVRVAGSGPTTVLWHSLFVDDRSWDGFVGALASERRLIRIEGPGHGRSTAVAPYGVGECAAAALAVLDALEETGPVDWVGNAWGGHVGIVLAARHPERIRTLLTFGAPVHALTRAGRASMRLLLLIYALLGPARFILRQVCDVLLADQGNEANRSYVLECLRSRRRRQMLANVRWVSVLRPDLTSELACVVAPTLFVTGPAHSDWTPDQARAAARLLQDGSVQIVPETAYLTPLEAPRQTADLAEAFWAAHAAG